MLKRGVLYLLVLSLFGCVRATVLIGPRQVEGSKPEPDALTLMISKDFNKHGLCAFVHQSIITKGKPFNHDYEIATDQIGCGWHFGAPTR